jgi:NAD(P)H-flavin reductase
MPFLDLVQIMVQQKLGDDSGVYPLDLLSPTLSLLLYCGFRSIKDNFAKELLDRAVNAFKSEPMPRLRILLVYDEGKAAKKLSTNLIQEFVIPDKVTRTWVCGPPGFNKFALDILLLSGVNRNVIMVM